jgi:hypothetical protein
MLPGVALMVESQAVVRAITQVLRASIIIHAARSTSIESNIGNSARAYAPCAVEVDISTPSHVICYQFPDQSYPASIESAPKSYFIENFDPDGFLFKLYCLKTTCIFRSHRLFNNAQICFGVISSCVQCSWRYKLRNPSFESLGDH